ncbi:sensor histidine kinase [Altererythrobacter xixiisoli]|uniref:histidine kinase n=1 Tax=Croceibacterium xixiisoli TaxID=1476466 RepID=A0A6I4TYY7_9SPHN|nr:HAMP domain-containing sensor histidine kinase [Croceibacterium xixiisoli]MXO99583.1 sensor histidine kinase [Croceibacterium xixiisoli]
MNLRALWSTASLRFALLFAALFGLGGAAMVTIVDFGFVRFAEAEVREGLQHQMAIMRTDVAGMGGDHVVEMLESQARNRDGRRYLFLVITPDGRTFSNGLTRAAANAEGFRRNIGDKPRAARWPDQKPNMLVLSQTANDGTFLAIGRDTQHLEELRGGMRSFALWSGLGLITLALTAGLAIGWLFLRRLEGVNNTVERIISGHTAERLPAIGFGREFDDLARNLNRMLARQEAAMEALKTVSEGIAHDLRTPLGRLRNRLEDLEQVGDDPARRQAEIDAAVLDITRITELFEALLTLSQVEGGRAAAQPVPLDAGALAASLGEIYRPVIEDAGGTLALDASADAGLRITGDAALLTQALANLLDNALNHAGAAGAPAIALRVQRRGDDIVLTVADNGPGIPAEEREKVLRRFYRMDRSRTRPGSGLGLPMAAAVARWHGGDIALGDRDGSGLVVELILPAAE